MNAYCVFLENILRWLMDEFILQQVGIIYYLRHQKSKGDSRCLLRSSTKMESITLPTEEW